MTARGPCHSSCDSYLLPDTITQGAAEVVDALLRWGADPLALSTSGQTAVDVIGERVEEKHRLAEDVEHVHDLLSHS